MKFRDRFLIQTVVCFMLFAAARGLSMADADGLNKVKDTVKGYMERNYSIEDVAEAGKDLAQKLWDAPAALTGAVVTANVLDRYGAPIDEKATDRIQGVHAVAKGTVVYAGIDKEAGMCIKVEHQDKVSVYGNLNTITAVTGDKVKKGEIIGTFDSEGKDDFYYQLKDTE